MGRKTCTGCQLEKDPAEFVKCRKGKGGLDSRCRSCQAVRAKQWAQTELGKTSRQKAAKRYAASDHGKKKRQEYSLSDAMKEVRKRWAKSEAGKESQRRHAGTGKHKAVRKRYYYSGKGKVATRRYQQTAKGRESLLRGCHKRRAALRLVVCDLTAEQWEEIKAEQGYRCKTCGRRTRLTRDHVIPLSKGGQHTASNIQALCRSCNSKKGVK